MRETYQLFRTRGGAVTSLIWAHGPERARHAHAEAMAVHPGNVLVEEHAEGMTTTVWVVMYEDYDDWQLIGVCDGHEKAKQMKRDWAESSRLIVEGEVVFGDIQSVAIIPVVLNEALNK
jgi:hypothetical protein